MVQGQATVNVMKPQKGKTLVIATLVISTLNLALLITAGAWIVLSARKAKRAKAQLADLLARAAAAKSQQIGQVRATA